MDNIACALIMTISRLLKMMQGLLYNISLKFYVIGILKKIAKAEKNHRNRLLYNYKRHKE